VIENRLRLQIQVSALAGFRAACHVLVFAVLFLPVGLVINIIFRRETHVDLKLAIIINAVFALSWYVITFVSTFLDMRKLDRIGAARMPSFPATALVAGLYGVVGIGSLWLMMGLHKEADPLWVQLLPLAGVALAFCAWPRTIHCERTSVSQRNLWGRKKAIPYAAVEAISVGYQGTTTVLGAGSTIEHTQYHVDPESFRHTLSSRSEKPVY
jgi:hypothetical protein